MLMDKEKEGEDSERKTDNFSVDRKARGAGAGTAAEGEEQRRILRLVL